MPPKKSNLSKRTKKSINMQANRANETAEEREIRLTSQRSRASTSRAAETSEVRETRLRKDRSRSSTSRAAETTEEHETRLRNDRTRASTSREAETSEERERRLRNNRSRNITTRAAETLEQSDERRQQNRAGMVQSLRNFREPYERIAFNYTSAIDFSADPSIAIGALNKVCRFCNALKYKSETPGMCCANGKIVLPELLPPPEPLLTLLSGKSDRIFKKQQKICMSFYRNHF